MKYLVTQLTAAVVILCGLMVSPPVLAQEIKLIVASAVNPKSVVGGLFQNEFGKLLEKYSGGRLALDGFIHLGGTLCSEHNCVEQARLGQVDLTTISAANIGAFGTTYEITNMPYIFKDTASARKIIEGWLADELQQRAHADMGLHITSLAPIGGFRQLAHTGREVRVPSDLKGIKIRATKSPMEYELLTAWGAVAVPYDWAQLYQGLQTGVVEGMYLADPWTYIAKMYEVTNRITHTGGAWTGVIILMDHKRYQKLPEWGQKAVNELGSDIQGKIFARDQEWIDSSVKELKMKKVAIYNPTPKEMELWYKGAVNAWLKVKDVYDPALARRVLADQGMDSLIKDLEAAGAL